MHTREATKKVAHYSQNRYYRAVKTQIVIRYKWKDRREEKWLFWLKKKLEKVGCTVLMLPITEADLGQEPEWIPHVQHMHGISEDQTFFVEHDPGCLTILKFIEKLIDSGQQDPALLVAGFNLTYGPSSTRKDIQIYKGNTRAREDIRLIILYGGSLGRMLENSEKLFLKSK